MIHPELKIPNFNAPVERVFIEDIRLPQPSGCGDLVFRFFSESSKKEDVRQAEIAAFTFRLDIIALNEYSYIEEEEHFSRYGILLRELLGKMHAGNFTIGSVSINRMKTSGLSTLLERVREYEKTIYDAFFVVGSRIDINLPDPLSDEIHYVHQINIRHIAKDERKEIARAMYASGMTHDDIKNIESQYGSFE